MRYEKGQSGFEGREHSIYSRMKQSRAYKNSWKKAPRKGHKQTPETRERISRSQKSRHRKLMESSPHVITRETIRWEDTHNSKRRVGQALRRAKCPELERYINERGTMVKQSTLRKDAEYLARSLKALPPPRKIRKEDLVNFLNREAARGVSQGTLNAYKGALRGFFKWLGKPELVGWMKTNFNHCVRRDRYTSLEHIQKFIDSCESLEERAFFAVLWEGDLRTSEALALTRNDTQVFEDRILLYVQGKTGERTVPILRKGKAFPLGSYSLLLEHVGNMKGNRLWTMVAYNQAQYRMKKIRAKAGMPWLHLHLFRKSRFTYNNEIGVPYTHACSFGGWVPYSKVTQRYLLAHGEHLIPSFRKANGLEVEE